MATPASSASTDSIVNSRRVIWPRSSFVLDTLHLPFKGVERGTHAPRELYMSGNCDANAFPPPGRELCAGAVSELPASKKEVSDCVVPGAGAVSRDETQCCCTD